MVLQRGFVFTEACSNWDRILWGVCIKVYMYVCMEDSMKRMHGHFPIMFGQHLIFSRVKMDLTVHLDNVVERELR